MLEVFSAGPAAAFAAAGCFGLETRLGLGTTAAAAIPRGAGAMTAAAAVATTPALSAPAMAELPRSALSA